MDKSRHSGGDHRPGEGLRLLIIDDEPSHAEAVAESLERVGYECLVATSGAEGARRIEEAEPNVILTDLKMDDVDGLAILRKAKQELPDAEVVVITGHGDVQSAVEAMKAGASNFLQKPVNLAELRTMVGKAAERFRLGQTNKALQQQLDEHFGFEGLIGNSPRMLEIVGKLKSIAPTQATVLIQGETGTGKELVAKAIHNNSPRKGKNFVAMNCTAINENLLEDELFGHEPHSFTGADRMRKGRFEHANGGTLFLDEVGDMPLTLQAKLLRMLENQEITRIGSNESIKVNVRLLSATHRDLEAAVADKTFRQDLYFRLKVVTIKLPPLRERREDIPLLTAHFPKEFNQKSQQARHRRRRAAAPGDRDLCLAGQRAAIAQRDREHGRAGPGRHAGRRRPGGDRTRRAVRHRRGRAGERTAGRPAADGDRAVLHREDAGTDRRQTRGGRQDAGHRRADALSRHAGMEAAGQDAQGADQRARQPGRGGAAARHQAAVAGAQVEEVGDEGVRGWQGEGVRG